MNRDEVLGILRAEELRLRAEFGVKSLELVSESLSARVG